jgi:ribosomal protein S16
MLGRENKNLIIRLLRSDTRKTVYHIIVTRKRTDGQARQDSIGRFVIINENMAYLKIDIKKLNFYLHKNIRISTAFAKILGIDNALITSLLTYKKQ